MTPYGINPRNIRTPQRRRLDWWLTHIIRYMILATITYLLASYAVWVSTITGTH